MNEMISDNNQELKYSETIQHRVSGNPPEEEPSKEAKMKDLFTILVTLANKTEENPPQVEAIQETQSNWVAPSMTESVKVQTLKQLGKDLDEGAGSIEDRVKFLSTAINDIKRIERESKNGNQISKRIYSKLNTENTK